MAVAQAILGRREGTVLEDFQADYKRHGRLVMPFWLANNVLSYAQIHNIRWSSPEVAQKYNNIDLSKYDAAAETSWKGERSLAAGPRYYDNVILPDEKRFLFSAAIEHLIVVDPGSVTGDRVDFIVDGKPIFGFDEWQELWDRWETPTVSQAT